MIVLKFGGTSVANSVNIKLVLNIINKKVETSKLIVVVSALSGVTDLLLLTAEKAAHKNVEYKTNFAQIAQKHIDTVTELIANDQQKWVVNKINVYLTQLKTILDGCFMLGELSPRTLDAIIGFGELMSSEIITSALQQSGANCAFKDSRELIKTDSNFGKAAVNFKKTDALICAFFNDNNSQIKVLPGFISSDEAENTTTLGRGGSDYTAAILANAMHAKSLEIWTDVSGMYTANPKIVNQAKPINRISYQEAMELSHFGAKVLYPPTIQPVLNSKIPIWIKNTFDPMADGTLISDNLPVNSNPIKGISHIDAITLLTLEGPGLIGILGASKRLFEALYNQNINVIFITQASSEHSICIGILNVDASKAVKAINLMFENEISKNKINSCIV